MAPTDDQPPEPNDRAVRNIFRIMGCGCLLTVAAMIGLVLYAVHRSEDQNNAEKCLRNIQSLEIGFAQYVQDYDERYPLAGPHGMGWAGAIYPYVKTPASFHCPSDGVAGHGSSYPVSYAMNSNLIEQLKSGERAMKATDLETSRGPILLFETSSVLIELKNPAEGATRSSTVVRSPVGNGLPPVAGTCNLTAGGAPILYACGVFAHRTPDPAYGGARHRFRDEPASTVLTTSGFSRFTSGSRISAGRTPSKSDSPCQDKVPENASGMSCGETTWTFSTR